MRKRPGVWMITLAVAVAAHAGDPAPFTQWRPIATSRDLIPGSDAYFSSFNQPSINHHGAVVFRARSRGPGEPVRGIFIRRMGAQDQPIEAIALRGTAVPDPNNTVTPPKGGGGGGEGAVAGVPEPALTSFNEFPSIPRIDEGSEVIAMRGVHGPVWTYFLEDESETRVGTAGIYVQRRGEFFTAFSLLGAVLDPETGDPVFPHFSVPGMPEGTRFDQFPGSPAIADGRWVLTKGNFTDPTTSEGKTGIYARDLDVFYAPLVRIASSDTIIPGQAPLAGGVAGKEPIRFGATAPPSAADELVAFLGVDNEESPTLGGIYVAPIANDPELTPIVSIGDQVPGEVDGVGFTRLGEALSFDGRFIAFWGGWGEAVREIELACPTDGNPDIIAWCNEQHPKGYIAEVPVEQGVFVHDLSNGVTTMVARTGTDKGDFTDFVFWGFSGRAPGTGGGGEGGEIEDVAVEEEGELARWRSATFIAVANDRDHGGTGSGYRVAFKARRGETDGIFSAFGPTDPVVAELVSVGSPASLIDAGATSESVVTAVAIEREAMRDGWIVIGISTEDPKSKEGAAGIFALGPSIAGSDANGDGRSDIVWHQGTNGRMAAWTMNGLVRESTGMLTRDAAAGTDALALGDLDGDRRLDIVWRDQSSGAFSAWFMNGFAVSQATELSGPIGARWSLVAVADLDDDARDDLIFLQRETGEVRAWIMDGATRVETGVIGLASGMEFLGAGDLDADGASDLLWRDESGAVHVWFMQGLILRLDAVVSIANAISANWKVVAVTDLDGDQRADVLWRHQTRGDVVGWLMAGAVRRASATIASGIASRWNVIDSSDFNGDGRGDILWRDSITGDVHGWLMSGLSRLASGFIRNASKEWHNVPSDVP
ncbi:MAG: hypothetical protein RL591_4 [Planctomycetota bacterium]